MKKFFCVLLISYLMITLTTINVFAAVDDSNMDKEYLVKQYKQELKQLGYPDETIKFLESQEIIDIVKNNWAFLYQKPNYDMFATYEANNSAKSTLSVDIQLTEEEYKKYKTNENEFIRENIETLNKLFKFKDKKDIKILESNKTESQFTIMSVPVTYTAIDYATLRTEVNVYDSSDKENKMIYKTVGLDFEWSGSTRLWSLTDGLALSHTASSLGYTNYIAKGGYYDGSAQPYYSINPDWSAYGISAKYDILGVTPHDTYGRIWARIGNDESAVTPGNFTIYGQYAHTELYPSFSISIGYGSISFTPSGATVIRKSTQAWLSDISSWY